MPGVSRHQPDARAIDPRTRRLIEAPIVPTLLRLAIPNTLVLAAQAGAGIIETYFIGKLGTDALAGVALVFPTLMLMQMLSGGAVGGGISSSIARALGGGRRDDANALVYHAILVGLLFSLFFTAGGLAAGRWLYAGMGGAGPSLDAAQEYSYWIFGGASLVWLFNSLASAVRGTGNMNLPAVVTCVGTMMLVPLSPLLIFGWGPLPGLGVAGGAIALLTYYAAGSAALLFFLCSGRGLVRLSLAGWTLRWPLFRDILRVGLVAAISTAAINIAISIATALTGHFGPAAIAGYGTGSRLEYLLVPLVFGLGGPMVAMVGAAMGAGRHDRALRIAWVGAGCAFIMTETIGLAAALFPLTWLSIFGTQPDMLATGSLYLHIVGPFYGFFGAGLALYFASQGAGRLFWPVTGSVVRLGLSAAGGMLAIAAGMGLAGVFAAQALALLVYGAINAGAVAKGAWFTAARSVRPARA
ncbi:MAG: MATE family efflux transporter [Pigmentiphaga sp.]|uniref:MATE family efflux transporter n=1 Tax=Pigmentiphaga sp. TaxID=1977564 RepID=UPI0029A2B24B|nr:MATE family efflux transporter [Pigmentiphaga sp.]MDX3907304.1 MATE family efflux transporter [Pigmentiphaga sp.]